MLKSIRVSSATNVCTKEDLNWVSRGKQSNSPEIYRRRKASPSVPCSPYLEVLYPKRTQWCFRLLLCRSHTSLSLQYKDIESSKSYSNLATQLFEADTSVNLGVVDFRPLISHSHKDVRSNVVVMYYFILAECFGSVLCNRVHNLFSIYQ